MSDRWRAVVAALLNPELRAVLGEVSSLDLTPNRRERAVARLAEIGLIAPTGDGGDWVVDEPFLRSMLAENAKVRKTGVDRYLDAEGRIDRYPLHDADRHELLVWVAAQAFAAGDVLTEGEVNERLDRFAPRGDVAVLRRYLVDHQLLERTRSGSEYALVVGSD